MDKIIVPGEVQRAKYFRCSTRKMLVYQILGAWYNNSDSLCDLFIFREVWSLRAAQFKILVRCLIIPDYYRG
ncbi:MAG: hypothetical protein UV38_C0001G0207 [candidate division TM6 bacterium GW2011_GWE2_42_60]|nr:MAG: hypothetical protein UV38_C0001G0207 [candidate division TM6 bacterium GW2011_GWE2_42_60]